MYWSAMNPASLKSNLKWAKQGATIILDKDAFDQTTITKAGYTFNLWKMKVWINIMLIKARLLLITRESVEQ